MMEKPKNKPKRKSKLNLGRMILLFIVIDCLVAVSVVTLLFITRTAVP